MLKFLANSIAGSLLLPLAAAAQSFPVHKLEPSETLQQDYIGTVNYAKSLEVSFELEGRLVYVIPAGSYVRSEVLNRAGEVVEKGDLLVQQDTTVAANNVNIAKASVDRAEEARKEAEQKYLRDKGLLENNAVAVKDYQSSVTAYNEAIIDKEMAELELRRALHVLDACSIYAPFNGIVEAVYLTRGASADVGDAVLKISMFDPVKIKLEITGKDKLPLSRITRAMIYPLHEDQPVPGWFSNENPLAGVVECYAANPLLPDEPVDGNGKAMPVIDRLSIVRQLPDREKLAPLWLNVNAVGKDGDTYFVWRLKGENLTQNLLTPGVAVLEKIKIEPLDVTVPYGMEQLQGIKGGSELKESDLLAGKVSADAVSGQLAVYRRQQHRFRVGDQVKVKFFLGDGEHIFRVPQEALRPNPTGNGLIVFRSEQGVARSLPVDVLNRTEGQARIHSPQLKTGMEILLPPTSQQLKDGDVVTVATQ